MLTPTFPTSWGGGGGGQGLEIEPANGQWLNQSRLGNGAPIKTQQDWPCRGSRSVSRWRRRNPSPCQMHLFMLLLIHILYQSF